MEEKKTFVIELKSKIRLALTENRALTESEEAGQLSLGTVLLTGFFYVLYSTCSRVLVQACTTPLRYFKIAQF